MPYVVCKVAMEHVQDTAGIEAAMKQWGFGADDIVAVVAKTEGNGGVNDIAFASPKQLCVITCGDDHTIKIWDASSGRKQYTFEGHEAPVYSVCPHHKENIQVGRESVIRVFPCVFDKVFEGCLNL